MFKKVISVVEFGLILKKHSKHTYSVTFFKSLNHNYFYSFQFACIKKLLRPFNDLKTEKTC